MLANPEGVRFLTEDKLLRQMVDCLHELDQVCVSLDLSTLFFATLPPVIADISQYAGPLASQPVFARDRLENSLTYGYFEMIGTLSKHREGNKWVCDVEQVFGEADDVARLLERFRFFNSFYHLSELRSRDDIVRIIIECFDYTMWVYSRLVNCG
jgi:rapamycin-insensitive companion of mTOR